MPVSEKPKKKFKLSVVVADIKAQHPEIDIETDDGQVFTVAPPQLWSDDVIAVGEEPVKATRLLLGNQYEAFIAAGGSAAILMQVVQMATGVDAGESSAS